MTGSSWIVRPPAWTSTLWIWQSWAAQKIDHRLLRHHAFLMVLKNILRLAAQSAWFESEFYKNYPLKTESHKVMPTNTQRNAREFTSMAFAAFCLFSKIQSTIFHVWVRAARSALCVRAFSYLFALWFNFGSQKGWSNQGAKIFI